MKRSIIIAAVVYFGFKLLRLDRLDRKVEAAPAPAK